MMAAAQLVMRMSAIGPLLPSELKRQEIAPMCRPRARMIFVELGAHLPCACTRKASRASGCSPRSIIARQPTLSLGGPQMRKMMCALAASCAVTATIALAQDEKPNILVIFGDDIGIANVSAYSDGLMGYTTPNIDRIAEEGMRFLHYYGEQSCTAGRAAFLTGQHGLRTGLTKVGFPGAPMGISQLDPTIGVRDAGPRLRDRAVRQEPCRRPQPVAADGQRLRRVLRQPLPPERRGGAGAAGLSDRPRVPGDVRAAGRAAHLGDGGRTTRRRTRASGRWGCSGSRTPGR